MDCPKVSICIPVFNAEPFIRQAIHSVLNQTYQNYELVVIDNNSTDNTLSIVSTFVDSRIRVVRNIINIGMGRNWNKALDEAKGDFIKILPADDFLYPECIERQVAEMLRGRGNIAFVCCARRVVNEKGKSLMLRQWRNAQGRISKKDAIRHTVRAGKNPFGEPGAVLINKDAALSAGTFDDSIIYVIDLDFWLRLLKYGDLVYLREPLAAFRVSKGSASVGLISFQYKNVIHFIDKVYKAEPWLSQRDIWLGKIHAIVNTLLRYVIYKAIL